MHAIATDLETGLIQIDVKGFWTLDHVEAFASDVREAARQVMKAGKRQVILYDYTGAPIQAAAVVAALQALAQDNAFRSRKVALYTGSPLARRQAKTIAAHGHSMQAFEHRDVAIAWLLAA